MIINYYLQLESTKYIIFKNNSIFTMLLSSYISLSSIDSLIMFECEELIQELRNQFSQNTF